MTKNLIKNIKLADGRTIPQIGLGLWQNKDQESFKQTIQDALEAGYRHFDSAQAYENEDLLGEALKESGIKRSELFITTKIHIKNFGPRKTIKSFKESLKKLQTDYVDLVLLHFPVPAVRKTSWLSLEELKKAGLARSIGVSNYTINHLRSMESYASELPVINQVEMHLFLQQQKLLEYCRSKNIVIEAYSPLAHAKDMNNLLIQQLAEKYQVSYAQIMLKWLLTQDVVILPKSVTSERIKQNIDLYSFELNDTDLVQLNGLNKNWHTCWNPELVP